MKKILFIVLILLLTIGCSNIENEINNKVINSSYTEVYNEIDDIINGSMSIKMFPTQEYEEKLYYYTKAIVNNLDKYTDEERNNLYSVMDIEYNFNLTKFGYNNDSYHEDLNLIKVK